MAPTVNKPDKPGPPAKSNGAAKAIRKAKSRQATILQREAMHRAIMARNVRIDEGDEEEPELPDFLSKFKPNSLVAHTWGVITDSDASAKPKKAAKKQILAMSTIWTAQDLSRCHILRLSLEIRELIYANLFLYNRTILIHSDMRAICAAIPQSHNLFLACRQIHDEAAAYFYRNNTFKFLIREDRTWMTNLFLSPRFLPLLKNIILDHNKQDYGRGWMSRTAKSLEILANAKVNLQSLTTIIYPQSLGLGFSMQGEVQETKISFSDWFDMSKETVLMKIIGRLRCRKLRVIVMVPVKVLPPENTGGFTNEQWQQVLSVGMRPGLGLVKLRVRRVVIEVDVACLGREESFEEVGEEEGKNGGGENSKVVDLTGDTIMQDATSSKQKTKLHPLDSDPLVITARIDRKAKTKAAMAGIKKLIQDIQRDAEAAVEQGGCRFMEDDES